MSLSRPNWWECTGGRGNSAPGGDAMLRVDATVLAVALGACALVVVLIGARSALVGSRSDLTGALRLAGAGAGAGDRRSRARLLTAIAAALRSVRPAPMRSANANPS